MNRREFLSASSLMFASPSLLAEDDKKFSVLGYTFGDNVSKYRLKKRGYYNEIAWWISESMADTYRVIDFYSFDKEFPPFISRVDGFKTTYKDSVLAVGKKSNRIIGLTLYQTVKGTLSNEPLSMLDASNYVAKEYESVANALDEKYKFIREEKKRDGNFFLYSKIYEKDTCTIRISRVFSEEGLDVDYAQLKLTYVDKSLYKEEKQLLNPKREGF